MNTDTERLDFLIENDAYVTSYFGSFRVYESCWDEDEELTPRKRGGWLSPREAIDAAMLKEKQG